MSENPNKYSATLAEINRISLAVALADANMARIVA